MSNFYVYFLNSDILSFGVTDIHKKRGTVLWAVCKIKNVIVHKILDGCVSQDRNGS
jgi:hypothetical protein